LRFSYVHPLEKAITFAPVTRAAISPTTIGLYPWVHKRCTELFFKILIRRVTARGEKEEDVGRGITENPMDCPFCSNFTSLSEWAQ
jgi:hypothetical protein